MSAFIRSHHRHGQAVVATRAQTRSTNLSISAPHRSAQAPPKNPISRNRTDDNILHRSTESILHRSTESILHTSKESILHRSTDYILHIHSKHVDRRDDKPDERADGRVHSTVHNLVELAWSRLSHSTVLRFWMESLSRRRQRWRELTWTFSSHHLLSSPSHVV
jgi:hypothetical protein